MENASPATFKRYRGLAIALAACVAALLLALGLALWAFAAAVGWASKQAPVAWETLKGQAPEVRRKIDEIAPIVPRTWEQWPPVKKPTLRDVPGEDVGGVARYTGLVRVRYAVDNGSRTAVFEARERMRPVADHYITHFLEKGWTYRVLYASENEERHEFQSGGVRVVVLHARVVAGTVRVEIAENTGPSADAAGKPAAPGRAP